MFNNNFEFKVHEQISDNNGNYLVLDITIEGKRITLLTIYGPNEDCPKFYENISDIISNLSNDVIMVGDFNLILDTSMDYFKYLHINNAKARQVVLEQMNTHNLIDIYREFYPDVKRYTWRKPNPLKQARLNFILVSNSL